MIYKARRHSQITINSILGMIGLELIRTTSRFKNYIPLNQTIRSAKHLGMSVGDFIDFKYNIPGTTQLTLDIMRDLGVFDHRIERVCEIGPGSGRYLEKTIKICRPITYEIYETAKLWRDWLAQNYPVIAHDADGSTLSFTKSHSMDLVHSHKVFPGLTFLGIFFYLCEMVRVVNHDGYFVFDVLSEECFNEPYLNNWVESGVRWPCCMMPSGTILEFFSSKNFDLCGDFTVPMEPGITHYFVFREHHIWIPS